jgi:hypothetical protein
VIGGNCLDVDVTFITCQFYLYRPTSATILQVVTSPGVSVFVQGIFLLFQPCVSNLFEVFLSVNLGDRWLSFIGLHQDITPTVYAFIM